MRNQDMSLLTNEFQKNVLNIATCSQCQQKFSPDVQVPKTFKLSLKARAF